MSAARAGQLVQQAAALRQTQRMEEALAAATEALRLDASHAQAAFAVAQLRFETWRPAAEAFARARALLPAHPDLVRNHALALAAEGDPAAAERLLETTLAAEPRWLDGHRTLAALRITHGDTDNFDRSYAAACAAQPGHASLWLAWFQQLATLKRWEPARAVLAAAKRALAMGALSAGGTAQGASGAHRGLALAEIFLDAETGALGAAAAAEARFAPYAALQDPGFDICRVRHWLRTGEPAKAAAVAEPHLAGATARLFWPYASLAWRLLGDARAEWLDGHPLYSSAVDLPFAPAELTELAELLRGLHRLRAPYPEQSVRGGTQTDRQLFFHPHPVIQSVRAKICAAVAGFVGSLPAAPPQSAPYSSHPLLGPRAKPIGAQDVGFEGSWSVRLAGAGFHASHTHHLGWISSALYVALPAPQDMGAAPAGWLGLGTPPPELGLPLQPYRRVEPKAGRLALFPSTMWHNTEPFAEGERLTIAFDVRLPAG